MRQRVVGAIESRKRQTDGAVCVACAGEMQMAHRVYCVFEPMPANALQIIYYSYVYIWQKFLYGHHNHIYFIDYNEI